jgi:predicted aldo/keto reductase-like oxidoreductase
MGNDSFFNGMNRRDWLKWGAAASVGMAATRLGGEELDVLPQGATGQGKPAPAGASAASAETPWNPRTAKAMPTRALGRTGHLVGIFSLGAQASVEKPKNADVAVPIVERALDLGVNYIDTSARYGGPERWSERYVGEVMKRRRKEVFLATKTHDRSADGSMQLLEKSLELLKTDHVDLWQLHAMATMQDVEKVCEKGGALEAFQKARDQKMVRFLGLSGHTDPDVLIEAIRRYPFDALLMTFNAGDKYHKPFKNNLLPLALEKELGIIGMKIPARGRLLTTFQPPEPRPGAAPLKPGTITMAEAMRYALSFPLSTIVVGCDDIRQLEENVQIAKNFVPLSEAQLAEIEKKVEPVAEQSQWYKRW